MRKFITTFLASLFTVALTATMSATSASADIIPTAPAAGFTYVDERSPQLVYSGNWKDVTPSPGLNFTDQNAKRIISPGSVTLTFQGSGIRYLSRTASWLGKAKVSVDNGPATIVDLYTLKQVFQKNVFEKRGLNPAMTHTIKIEWTGTANPAAAGSGIEVDAFHVLDGTAPTAAENVKFVNKPTGVNISWDANKNTDFKEYVLEKADYGLTNYVVVTPPAFTGTAFEVISVKATQKYQYRITTYDTSNNSSVKNYSSTYAPALVPILKAENCPAATVVVTNDTQLKTAMTKAKAGDVIKLSDGKFKKFTYDGSTVVGVKPSALKPLWICGSANTLVDAESVSTPGNGLSITKASYVNVANINFTGGHRGINVTYSDHITLTGNTVKKVGLEGIHLMNQTVDSTVANNVVEDTGLSMGRYGEGVYVGTSEANWGKYNNGIPDTSDRNRIVNNTFTRTASECVDAKTSTKGGLVQGNVCDVSTVGTKDTDDVDHGINGISIRGDSWIVDGNTFVSNTGAVNSKLENVVRVMSYKNNYDGYRNIIRNNVAGVGTDSIQFGVMGADPSKSNFASCNNKFYSAGMSLYQFACQQ